jgi:hypothetical protein
LLSDETELKPIHDHHVQKVMYIPQASSETIYSPKIQYEYDASDVRIITQDIQDDNDQ